MHTCCLYYTFVCINRLFSSIKSQMISCVFSDSGFRVWLIWSHIIWCNILICRNIMWMNFMTTIFIHDDIYLTKAYHIYSDNSTKKLWAVMFLQNSHFILAIMKISSLGHWYHGLKYWPILIYIGNIIIGFEVTDTILTR